MNAAKSELENLERVQVDSWVARALQIAAVGGHNVRIRASQNVDVMALGRLLAAILPPLDAKTAAETSDIYERAGERATFAQGGRRPCREVRGSGESHGLVHLVGGGKAVKPGEVSLAHGVVLALEDLGSFSSPELQAIRHAAVQNEVTIARADGFVTFPSRFQIVAGVLPCPCGRFGGPESGSKWDRCNCSYESVRAYQERAGRPLMNQMDIRVDAAGTAREFTTVADLREEVAEAIAFRAQRDGHDLVMWGDLDPDGVDFCQHDDRVRRIGSRVLARMLSVARSIADLEHREEVSVEDLREAAVMS